MKALAFLLAVFILFSCKSTRYSANGSREDVPVTGTQKETDGSNLPFSLDRSREPSGSIQSDYLEKDRDGVFFGNIYKLKQKKNRIVLKRQGMAKSADTGTIN